MIPGRGLARRLHDRSRRRRRRAGILMYHCITETDLDPWGICVSPAAFDEQMAVLSAARAGADLGELRDPSSFTATGSKIAVTFDDGYADNLAAALPILERHEIPATVFVIGTAVGRTREFWWDALERAVLGDLELPEELRFPFGTSRTFRIDDHPVDIAETRTWRADLDGPSCDRQQLFRDLWEAIVVLAPEEQDDAVDYLLEWAGHPVDAPAPRPALTADEFADLAAHPLITIGSHTLDHASLTDLDPAAQHRQIARGRDRIRELSGLPVTRFSFPYGRYDATAVDAVRRAGIELACTSRPVAAIADDDPLTLPRLQVLDDDGDTFARKLYDDHRLAVGALSSL
ncbi:MAG: polysaccharide deacetylase family protein [Gordonia sp. (in: high G+C Gram-positive bacteria)]|uniref:polysaccharide deacetylase family protein n=1 Tax=Gordonia sp. (in: high G+C Gram-positive bacteria) TaxID=84139 RepID=UPI0039E3B178